MMDKERGGSSVWLLLIVLGLVFAYFWSSVDNIQSALAIPAPYSAKYALEIDNGFHKDISKVQPGLYRYDAHESGVVGKFRVAFMAGNTFQIDAELENQGFFAAPRTATGVVRGQYIQTGSVLEFSDLNGDKGLLPDPPKLLLGAVRERGIDIVVPSKQEQSIYYFVQDNSKPVSPQ